MTGIAIGAGSDVTGGFARGRTAIVTTHTTLIGNVVVIEVTQPGNHVVAGLARLCGRDVTRALTRGKYVVMTAFATA